MFNPFIENLDELSDDELTAKISELRIKMNQASKVAPNMLQQLQIALSDHMQEQSDRMRKRQQEDLEKGDDDTGKVIKIE